jgi:hypothetical protein
MDIPVGATLPPHYLIQFDDGTTKSVPAADMSSLIPKALVDVSDSTHLLPPFLQLNSKITFEQKMASITKATSHICLMVSIVSAISHRCIRYKQEDWGVSLPHLPTTWHNLCMEGLLLPGHMVSSFTCISTPMATFVSAADVTCDCPCSLLTALAKNHPD